MKRRSLLSLSVLLIPFAGCSAETEPDVAEDIFVVLDNERPRWGVEGYRRVKVGPISPEAIVLRINTTNLDHVDVDATKPDSRTTENRST